ncbi:MAG: alpha-2-macroglobulin family protein [Bacteroidales bacterium]
MNLKKNIINLLGIFTLLILISSFTLLCSNTKYFNTMASPIDYETYDADWKKIDSLVGKGLPKSALELTEKIYTKAQSENNYPQFIKAILYKIKLNADYTEEFIERTVNDLNAEIEESEEPATQILHSIQADMYWRYYQANRYKFMDRTTLETPDMSDIRTWDMKTIMGRIIHHFYASLENPELLKRTSLKDYDAIITTQKESKKLRPTLYDFLAHRAIDFFMNDESSFIQPAFVFVIDKKEYFAQPLEFSRLNLETKDSLSLKYYALELLQDLIIFHQNDEEPTAMTDVNLKRLNFVRNNSTHEFKDSLYLQSLLDFEDLIGTYPSSVNVTFEIASELFKQSNDYKPLISDKHKWDAKKAVEKCNEAIKKLPESVGGKNCATLKATIQDTTFTFSIERENEPKKPILSLLTYKNARKLYFRIIKLDYYEDQTLSRSGISNEKQIETYLTKEVHQSWELTVPNDGDFQSHHTEIKIPALSAGYYVLLAGDSENFDVNKHTVSFQSFWVSGLSYISQSTPKNSHRIFVLDRTSGTPRENVNVKLFYQNYDYRTREYTYADGETFTTDENGYIEIPSLTGDLRPNSFKIEFTDGTDKLISENRFYRSPYSPPKEQKFTRTTFFTDRAIYRPGQTVYFKGIVLETFKGENSILTDHKTTIELMDVNYQKISSLELTTNEYGSFHGSFTAPQGGLNGQMTIKNETGSHIITVEEYKRPKFEVVFNPVKGSFKIGENIEVTGQAKAYAGNAISGADVTFRVIRKVYYPWPWHWGFIDYWPSSTEMEITNGLTQTDVNGNFTIEFTAIPDYSIPIKFQPAFNYTVIADVTDINNETQSAQRNVNVSYKAMTINTNIGEVLNKDEFNSFSVSASNLNGVPVPASGNITISLLEEPKRLLREQSWRSPDVFVLDEANFIKDFPFDIYNDENKPDKLKVKSIVKELNFNTETDSLISVPEVKTWLSGRYKLEIKTKDEFGSDVEFVKYLILFSTTEKTPPLNELNWFYALNSNCKPGENAKFIIGSKEKNIRVLYEITCQEKIVKSEWISLNNEQKIIEIPVTEEYRGGFGVNLIFVHYNRIFNNSFTVDVPLPDKKLDFEFTTFRDKLIPGQKEEWTIKIRGSEGDKIAAELVSGMYDASLDKFKSNFWEMALAGKRYRSFSWNAGESFQNTITSSSFTKYYPVSSHFFYTYDELNWFGFNYYGSMPYRQSRTGYETDALPMAAGQNMQMDAKAETVIDHDEESFDNQKTYGEDNTGNTVIETSAGQGETDPVNIVQVRRDFRETAFFYPNLKTNEDGDVSISFTVPESLTRWKLMGLAHSKDLKFGQFTKEVITQKNLMVVPNPPRFFRQGDKMTFSAKVINMKEENYSGETTLQFFDTRTMEDISGKLLTSDQNLGFEIGANGNKKVEWEIIIPEEFDVITYRIVANAGDFSDGEEKPIPVLSNRMLVTESLPLPVKGNETKNFTFKKLKDSKGNTSLKNHKLTLEFSSNPAWYAVQALPYMMEGTHESAENVFYRFYANTIASFLANSNPKIKQVFDTWKNYTPDALLSNLEKNQELKALILNETPWVRDAQNETERKQRIAVLFDLNKMADEKRTALRKLIQLQSQGGGWPWFKGMPDNRFITQQIVTGLGHLKNIGVFDPMKDEQVKSMLIRALQYLDQMIKGDHDRLLERDAKLDENHLGNTQIQYLYARSYFLKQLEIPGYIKAAYDYYIGQAKKYWVERQNFQKGLISLSMHRSNEVNVASMILASIKEHALYSDEMGMYWRDNTAGWYWYEAPIETQALLIEAFDEVSKDTKSVEQMKIWLLKQKQTQDWKTTKATAEAVYALLLRGSDWLVNDELAEIKLGNITVDPLQLEDTKVEAGTGYFKTSWSTEEIKPVMGNITVTNENPTIAWGAVYWQYFEDLDKITFAETPLKLKKELFVEANTDAGPVLKNITDEAEITIGDKIIVRIELRVDRDMEFVHMKDMRASAFEPVNVLSGYHYQGGLGYYESTLDVSTNFFFDYLRKGTYVFEYPLIASQKGDFSNGITSIQCMYAPEFTSHSEGIRVIIK